MGGSCDEVVGVGSWTCQFKGGDFMSIHSPVGRAQAHVVEVDRYDPEGRPFNWDCYCCNLDAGRCYKDSEIYGEEGKRIIPDDCPLRKGPVVVRLKEE